MTDQTLNGTDLVLMINTGTTDYVPIAHATSHTMTITRALRSIVSKSTGPAEGRAYGKYSISISADALITQFASMENFDTLLARIIAGTKVILLGAVLAAADTPLSDTVALTIQDATGNDQLDEASVDMETTDDEFITTTTPDATKTPHGYYLTACLASVEMTGGDSETGTMSFSAEGDGKIQMLDITAFAGA